MDELLEIELDGWRALTGRSGAHFYDRVMSADARMVFPMGVFDRASSLDAIRSAAPWETFHVESESVIRPAPNVGIVVYRATAKRAGSDEYQAWMSSTYIRDDEGAWKLVLHQQSPG
jgi:hypothetical protein